MQPCCLPFFCNSLTTSAKYWSSLVEVSAHALAYGYIQYIDWQVGCPGAFGLIIGLEQPQILYCILVLFDHGSFCLISVCCMLWIVFCGEYLQVYCHTHTKLTETELIHLFLILCSEIRSFYVARIKGDDLPPFYSTLYSGPRRIHVASKLAVDCEQKHMLRGQTLLSMLLLARMSTFVCHYDVAWPSFNSWNTVS